MSNGQEVSLISRWFVKPGKHDEALAALRDVAAEVWANEPDTLTYFIHTDYDADSRLQALPPMDSSSILFFETYRNADAFLRHVNGPTFKNFVQQHGELFLGSQGAPYTTVEFLFRYAGFSRQAQPGTGTAEAAVNMHPAVMFEIIAKDQESLANFYAEVFGWHYETGTGDFRYIHFPGTNPPLLGGIGQANANPGFEPGHNFYLLVDDLQAAIGRAVEAGGTTLMPPTSVDGYSFAMISDPEDNPVGLVEPFGSQVASPA